MQWDTEAVTIESFKYLATEILTILTVYVKDKGLFDDKGWIKFKCLANGEYLTQQLD